jgi:rhodanese-related sulfurtransferase
MEQFSEFVGNHLILFSLLAAVSVALVLNIWAGISAPGKSVTPPSLIQLINHESAAVLDIRDREAFERGHIMDAVHIPVRTLQENLVQLERYKQGGLVVVCQAGNLAAQATGILAKSGFTDLYRLQGGISAWQSENLPLTRE